MRGNKAEVINEFVCTSSKMKLQAVIGGDKNFVEDQVHEGMQLSGIIFEEYAGHVPTIKTFLAFCTAELLDRWIREYKPSEKIERNPMIL